MHNFADMLELMHHDYFKRPDPSGQVTTPKCDTKLREEENSFWTPISSSFVLTCISAENTYDTPEGNNAAAAQNENSRSPIAPRKRPAAQSASPQLQRNKGYMRSSSSSLKPIRLSRVFSLSENSSFRSRSHSIQSSLCALGKSKKRSVYDRFRERDYIREYASEDELWNKFPGIDYHIFDEAEVLEAIAEAQGNQHHHHDDDHHQSTEIVPSSLVEIESTTAAIPEMENLLPSEGHEVVLSSSGTEVVENLHP